MKEKLLQLTEYNGLYDHWKELVTKLEKKPVNVNITDFDETIFARKEQLAGSQILRENRGNRGNKKIVNEIGITNYINTWFKGKSYLDTITKRLNPETDIILTAGYLEIQTQKLEALHLTHIKKIVVLSGKEKIIATIQYIIFDLGFIPDSITIYEDRPEYFVEYRELLEDILSTKIIINKVVMDGNDTIPEINEV